MARQAAIGARVVVIGEAGRGWRASPPGLRSTSRGARLHDAAELRLRRVVGAPCWADDVALHCRIRTGRAQLRLAHPPRLPVPTRPRARPLPTPTPHGRHALRAAIGGRDKDGCDAWTRADWRRIAGPHAVSSRNGSRPNRGINRAVAVAMVTVWLGSSCGDDCGELKRVERPPPLHAARATYLPRQRHDEAATLPPGGEADHTSRTATSRPRQRLRPPPSRRVRPEE